MTPWFLRTSTLLIILAIAVIAATGLYILISSPFGWVFWTTFFGLLISTALFMGLAGIRLIRAPGNGKTLAGGLLCCCGFSLLFVTGLGAVDYRLLFFRELPGSMSQDAWREDLDYLAAQLPDRHPDLFSLIDQERYEQTVADIRRDLPGMTDAQIIAGLMKVVALPDDGHTMMLPFHPGINFRFYPIKVFSFSDSWYITDARLGYEHMIGARLIAIGDTPIKDVFDHFDTLIGAENEGHTQERFAMWGMAADLLHAEGILETPDQGVFVLEDSEGKRFTVEMPAAPFFTWGLWYFLMPGGNSASPAVTSFRSSNYRFALQESSNTLYVQINQIENQGSESFVDFIERLRLFVDTHDADRYVIDIRNNLGGNNALSRRMADFLSTHPKINRRGRLFTIIGRKTFSAGINLASMMENRTKTLFVGEPAGQGPNQFGDARSITLPNARIPVDISSLRWEGSISEDTRQWITPDIPVSYTYQDFANDRDPAMEAILAYEPLETPEVAFNTEHLAQYPGRYFFSPYHLVTITGADESLSFHLTDFSPRSLFEVQSDLYPVAADTFRTDINHVRLIAHHTRDRLDSLAFDWGGVRKPLTPVPEGFVFPLERILSGNVREGIALLREDTGDVYRQDPFLERKLNGLGYHYLRAGRHEEAIAVFSFNIELFPASANVYDSMGEAYFVNGDRDLALENYRKTLELNPENTNAAQMVVRLE